ncbi:MAG: uridine kinase [Bdellovibrionaceae bacterium]|nr:uridine kinase [Pseudobdellovibrionaceae bacterium]
MHKSFYIVVISGGSGAGKSTFSNALLKKIGTENVQILSQDNYYVDQSQQFDGDGKSVNFDHPRSLDFSLLLKHICSLKNGENVKTPVYDFVTHTRQAVARTFSPKPILIVEGTLVMAQKEIRKISDLLIFVDCNEDLRLKRRLSRDVVERGRTEEGVREQFINQVAPMHNQFVEPSKTFANIIVSVSDFEKKINEVVLQLNRGSDPQIP